VTCRVCGAAGVELLTFDLELKADTTLTVRAPLCTSCRDAAPEKVRSVFNSPIIRSFLTVVGSQLGFRV